MPPLPPKPTPATLSARLNTLSDQNKAILQLVQRLAKLDFQPGSQPLDSEEGDIRLELSAEIHESLKSCEEELELVAQEVEDFVGTGSTGSAGIVAFGRRSEGRRDSEKGNSRDSERSRLAVLLARLTEDLKSSRSQFRKAQLAAKHAADRAKLKERDLLFSSLQSGTSTPSSVRRRGTNNQQLSESEIVAQAATDVTGALRRTHQLMQQELSRSRFAQETLEQSTAALADLGDKYSDLNSLLANSRTLVSTLLKSQKSDTWYLETTFYILITTVIWLIFRRWLYGPVSWFLIWPLKLVFRVLFAVVPIGTSTAVAASSSSLAAASSSSSSLIVQPSASSGPKKRPNLNTDTKNYVRVGGGGRGANQPQQYPPQQDPSPPQSLSQSIGQMAEQNQNEQKAPEQEQQQQQQQQQQQTSQQQKEEEPVVRGDGTVLQPRGDIPRNPKKKMWEEDTERRKFEDREKRDSAKETHGGVKQKRDEL